MVEDPEESGRKARQEIVFHEKLVETCDRLGDTHPRIECVADHVADSGDFACG
jgi:hypothetical protein